MPFVLLLGGARSGKSAAAERLAKDTGSGVTIVATAEARDSEMAERIRRHREARPAAWHTIEAPLDLLGALGSVARDDFVVIDCLTLWVSNLLEHGTDAGAITLVAQEVAMELTQRQGVVVTNEVGLGIVPGNEMARTFRDVLGSVNSLFAGYAERAVLMVAGRALDLSSAGIIPRRD